MFGCYRGGWANNLPTKLKKLGNNNLSPTEFGYLMDAIKNQTKYSLTLLLTAHVLRLLGNTYGIRVLFILVS